MIQALLALILRWRNNFYLCSLGSLLIITTGLCTQVPMLRLETVEHQPAEICTRRDLFPFNPVYFFFFFLKPQNSYFMLLNPFPSSLLICRSVFSSLVTTSNQEKKKKSWNFLPYNSTFSRGYWCASKLRRYAAPQKEYFIDYVSTVQMFSTWFAGRNSFNLVNISGRSLTSICGSFTSFYRKAGSQLQKSCRSSNRWQTVDSAEKFPSVAT